MHFIDKEPWAVGLTPFQGSFFDTDPSSGRSIKPDTPELQKSSQQSEELRTFQTESGRIAVVGQCFASDAAILEGLRKVASDGKAEALTQWPGSYSTVVIQPNKVTATSDISGRYPLYYQSNTERIAIGTHASLIGSADGRSADSVTLAAQIACPGITELAFDRSAYRGTNCLQPAHILQANRGFLQTSRYEWGEPDQGTDLTETSKYLAHVIRQAVQYRIDLGGKLSFDFSGGMDSTSLAFLAMQHGHSPDLFTSHHPRFPTDDLGHVKAFLDMPESKRANPRWHEFFITDEEGAFAGLTDLHVTDEPDATIFARAHLKAYYRHIRSKGGEIHITGDGGDAIADMGQEFLASLLAAKGLTNPLQTYRMACDIGRIKKVAPIDLLRQAYNIARVGLGESYARVAGMLQKPQDFHFENRAWLGISQGALWLTTAARKELADHTLAFADSLKDIDIKDKANYTALQGIQSLGKGKRLSAQYSDGLILHAPYLDGNVVKAALSLASHERCSPHVFKKILAEALKGLVPGPVLTRQSKGNYTAWGNDCTRRALPDFQRLLNNSRLADLGIIEPSRVHDALMAIAEGRPVPIAPLSAFAGAESWLRSLDTSPAPKKADAAITIQGQNQRITQEEQPLSWQPDPATPYGITPNVLFAQLPSGGILLNPVTDTYHRLNATGAAMAAVVSRSADIQTALQALGQVFPNVDPDRLRSDALNFTSELFSKGLLSEGGGELGLRKLPQNAPHIITDNRIHEALVYKIPQGERLVAMSAFVLSAVLRHKKPISHTTDLLSLLQEKWCIKNASLAEATQTLAAVHKMSELHPGRVACLELSVAAALASTILRRRVNLNFGVAVDPNRFHAWISTLDGEPVLLPEDDDPKIYTMAQPIKPRNSR